MGNDFRTLCNARQNSFKGQRQKKMGKVIMECRIKLDSSNKQKTEAYFHQASCIFNCFASSYMTMNSNLWSFTRSLFKERRVFLVCYIMFALID